jgi:hypothetical protein
MAFGFEELCYWMAPETTQQQQPYFEMDVPVQLYNKNHNTSEQQLQIYAVQLKQLDTKPNTKSSLLTTLRLFGNSQLTVLRVCLHSDEALDSSAASRFQALFQLCLHIKGCGDDNLQDICSNNLQDAGF